MPQLPTRNPTPIPNPCPIPSPTTHPHPSPIPTPTPTPEQVHAAEAPRGTARLELGDVILSVDGAVTESSRETIKYMQRGPARLTFVLAGRSLA